jgi:hypothetical protein
VTWRNAAFTRATLLSLVMSLGIPLPGVREAVQGTAFVMSALRGMSDWEEWRLPCCSGVPKRRTSQSALKLDHVDLRSTKHGITL